MHAVAATCHAACAWEYRGMAVPYEHAGRPSVGTLPGEMFDRHHEAALWTLEEFRGQLVAVRTACEAGNAAANVEMFRMHKRLKEPHDLHFEEGEWDH